MKRLLTLFLVLWCSTAWAVEPIDLARGFNPYVAGAGVAAAQICSATATWTEDTNSNNKALAYDPTNHSQHFVGQSGFSYASDISICRVDVKVENFTGTVTGIPYVISVYTLNSTSLDVEVCTSDITYGPSSCSNCLMRFDFSTPCSILASNSRAIVIRTQDGSESSSNYISPRVGLDGTSIPGDGTWWRLNKGREDYNEAIDVDFAIYLME